MAEMTLWITLKVQSNVRGDIHINIIIKGIILFFVFMLVVWK